MGRSIFDKAGSGSGSRVAIGATGLSGSGDLTLTSDDIGASYLQTDTTAASTYSGTVVVKDGGRLMPGDHGLSTLGAGGAYSIEPGGMLMSPGERNLGSSPIQLRGGDFYFLHNNSGNRGGVFDVLGDTTMMFDSFDNGAGRLAGFDALSFSGGNLHVRGSDDVAYSTYLGYARAPATVPTTHA